MKIIRDSSYFQKFIWKPQTKGHSLTNLSGNNETYIHFKLPWTYSKSLLSAFAEFNWKSLRRASNFQRRELLRPTSRFWICRQTMPFEIVQIWEIHFDRVYNLYSWTLSLCRGQKLSLKVQWIRLVNVKNVLNCLHIKI